MKHRPKGVIRERIYAYIVAHINETGLPPTIREIGAALEISSTSHIEYHLRKLEEAGRIMRLPGKNRSIQLSQASGGIPVIGAIAAGVPLDIFPLAPDALPIDQFSQPANVFALVVRGNSMIEDFICDGDYVLVNPDLTCQNGDIAVATHLHSGVSGSATLKRLFQEGDHVRLQPANAEMKPIFIPKEEWDCEWQVQGKVIAILRAYPKSEII